ncbi:MAG: hypothetical protein AAAFM81_01715 [Pseudomonadota bacterium]
MNEQAKLKDGSEWAEHEDHIIGNETGLRNLIAACEAALKDGAYDSQYLGDYVGVKKLDDAWFEKPSRSSTSFFQNALLGIMIVAVIVFALIGIYTTVGASV